jgi:hypothetical protein
MPNHFFAVTSNGGYFGRIFWSNTGTLAPPANHMDYWGTCRWWPPAGPFQDGWAGSIGLVRYLTVRCIR